LESVRATDQQASNELDELRRLEDDGRVRLEESRQRVKDKSRVVQTIESEMERARETLTKEKVSYSDITQAIQQISGTGILGPEEGENLLF
jgi:phosphohistidine phosphatase SixA